MHILVLLLLPRPPTSTLFPYTTLFRSDVYLGLNEKLGQRVAVKFLNQKFTSDERIVLRFLNEARSYCKVNHPNAVTRSEEHTSELQSRPHLVCRLLLEKKKEYDPTPLR